MDLNYLFMTTRLVVNTTNKVYLSLKCIIYTFFFQYINCPRFLTSQEEIDYMEHILRNSNIKDLQYILSPNGQTVLKYPDGSWIKLDGYSASTKTAYEYYGVSKIRNKKYYCLF